MFHITYIPIQYYSAFVRLLSNYIDTEDIFNTPDKGGFIKIY